ncbi:LysR family transcriptional regulator [Ensifer sp. HO-A22]|jgi:aminoethylphosphonate catabolism LysR family transcriptional regulator|uniref:LysR family transcriptional regulator n=1 Tax=Ensifer oleiphilus TaxID=2742698 RepID=A0A7Y6UR57_9HYPH|nr:LysR substrate-binding domain-containing protein [Ensifer oleiphilus]NVD42992.1 LysR family transcriptional regulator [Ensifer oleiphilus]
MSITQLKAFHIVALSGGFSQAARDMAISQSTLSQHVRELEADCGQNLLDRKARGVSLSAHGERLFEITSRLFQAEKEANAFLRGEAGVNGGHLRVAADGPILALPILSRLKVDRPKLTFSLAVDNSARVIDQIIDYRADVAITAQIPDDPRLHGVHFLSMRLGLCVPSSHPLAARDGVTMKDLEGLSFVMRERGSRTREIFEKNIADHGISIHQLVEISSREGVREAIANGVGFGVVADLEFGHDARLSFVPIDDAKEVIDEYAICLAERRHLPLIRGFIDEASRLHPDAGETFHLPVRRGKDIAKTITSTSLLTQ